MHPARLDFLSVRHAPARKVWRCDDGASLITFHLECGHTSHMAPHFDPRGVTHRNCTPCGEHHVRTAPEYAREFPEPAEFTGMTADGLACYRFDGHPGL